MNGYFIVACMLLVLSLFVHTFVGNRFYSAARPDPRTATQKACEAWLMGRCGVQLITADLTLAATFVLLLGTGGHPPQPVAGSFPARAVRRMDGAVACLARLRKGGEKSVSASLPMDALPACPLLIGLGM